MTFDPLSLCELVSSNSLRSRFVLGKHESSGCNETLIYPAELLVRIEIKWGILERLKEDINNLSPFHEQCGEASQQRIEVQNVGIYLIHSNLNIKVKERRKSLCCCCCPCFGFLVNLESCLGKAQSVVPEVKL